MSAIMQRRLRSVWYRMLSLLYAGIALILLPLCIFLAYLPMRFEGEFVLAFIDAACGCLIAAFPCYFLLRKSRRFWSRPHSLTEIASSSPSVLYLRSYYDEESIRDNPIARDGLPFEIGLVSVLENLGTVVAISPPGEKTPPLGALRLSVEPEHWQSTISDLGRRCKLIVFLANRWPSSGIAWEFSTLFRQRPFTPILIALPFLYGHWKTRVERYPDFRAFLERTASCSIPPDPRGSHYVYFEHPDQGELLFPRPELPGHPLASVLASIDTSAFHSFQRRIARQRYLLLPGFYIAVVILLAWGAFFVGWDRAEKVTKDRIEFQSFCDEVTPFTFNSVTIQIKPNREILGPCARTVQDVSQEAAKVRRRFFIIAIATTVFGCALALHFVFRYRHSIQKGAP